MGDSERYDRGRELLERIDGDLGRQTIEDVGSVSPDLARYVVEFPYGDVWSRPGLDPKMRELATVSSLITLGHCEPQLKVHMSRMLTLGWTRDEILEVIIQMTVYAGFPTALKALTIAAEIFEEADQAR
ncbi:MAG: carboxymuconolactone decarboxylase family protein [Candidatus Geothermincolia bacterium]